MRFLLRFGPLGVIFGHGQRQRTSGGMWLAVLILVVELQWAPWALLWTIRAGFMAMVVAAAAAAFRRVRGPRRAGQR